MFLHPSNRIYVVSTQNSYMTLPWLINRCWKSTTYFTEGNTVLIQLYTVPNYCDSIIVRLSLVNNLTKPLQGEENINMYKFIP